MPSAYRSVYTEHIQYVYQHTFTGVLTHLKQLPLHKHSDWRVRLNMCGTSTCMYIWKTKFLGGL